MFQEKEGFARRGTIKQSMKGGIEQVVQSVDNTVENSNHVETEMESVRTQELNRTDVKSNDVYTERKMQSQKKPTTYQDLENYNSREMAMQGSYFPQKSYADKTSSQKDQIMKYCAFFMFCILFVVFLVNTFLSQVHNRQDYIVPSHQYLPNKELEFDDDKADVTPKPDQIDNFEYKGDLGAFVQSIQKFPEQEIFSKFQMGDNSDKFKQEWNNDVYGGSVLDPIVEISISKDGIKKAENIPNYLRAHLQNLRQGWHYFNLKNIFVKRQRTHSFFVDVEIITTESLDKQDYDFLRGIESRFKGSYSEERRDFLKDYSNLDDFATMEEIEPFLSGYGRFIFYDVYGYAVANSDGTKVYDPMVDPELNKITAIKEGQFFQGKADGYSRIMDPSRRVQVGFFKEDWPYGKMKEYFDGELMEQGIYDELLNEDDEDSFLKAMDIKSFEENVDPMDYEDTPEN